MLEMLDELNFEEFKDDTFESYDEFCDYIDEMNLEWCNFYVDHNKYTVNRIWYIEEYITMPMMVISKKYFEMFSIKESIEYRRKCIEELKEKKDYVSIFGFIEKPFRMSYFQDIYKKLKGSEFIELFKFVYSSCEYNFDMILTEDVLRRLNLYKDTETIKEILRKEFNLNEDIVTIYRGEADKSTHYKDGAVSWTLDCKVASFFANRFWAKKPKIYKATVKVEDILMYIERESEVLVLKENLLNVEEIS